MLFEIYDVNCSKYTPVVDEIIVLLEGIILNWAGNFEKMCFKEMVFLVLVYIRDYYVNKEDYKGVGNDIL